MYVDACVLCVRQAYVIPSALVVSVGQRQSSVHICWFLERGLVDNLYNVSLYVLCKCVSKTKGEEKKQVC